MTITIQDGFQGTDIIELLPGDKHNVYAFELPIKEFAKQNKFFFPYNTTISGALITAYDEVGDTVDDLVGTVTTDDDTVYIPLDYPTTTMSGVNGTSKFKLTIIAYSSDGQTEFDIPVARIEARDY